MNLKKKVPVPEADGFTIEKQLDDALTAIEAVASKRDDAVRSRLIALENELSALGRVTHRLNKVA